MATTSKKTERRWLVVKSVLLFLAMYCIVIFVAFLEGFDVEDLSSLTELLYGSAVVGIVGNWFSSPKRDEE